MLYIREIKNGGRYIVACNALFRFKGLAAELTVHFADFNWEKKRIGRPRNSSHIVEKGYFKDTTSLQRFKAAELAEALE